MTASLDVIKIRQDFPILERRVHDKPLIFLDSAASSQKPACVIEAMDHYYRTTHANVHRGVHTLSEEATEQYEGARKKIARFINARSSREVIYTRNATEAINLVAFTWGRANLRPGDEVLLTESEHHSNIVPWQMVAKETGAKVRYIPVDARGYLDTSALNTLLTRQTKIVGIASMSNVLGTIMPVQDVIACAREVGARVVVDGAQGVPSLLILSLSYMCFAYVGWMFLFWFPDYLVEGRGFSLGAMGLIGIAVHGAGFVGLVGGGALSDRLLRTGWSPQFACARFSGIGVALSLPFLLGAVLAPSASVCVVALLLFYFLFASAIAGYTTVALEFNPHVAGSIFGLINTLGSFAGIFGAMTAGFLLARSGDWMLPFVVATSVGAVCAAILFVVPIRPIVLDTLEPSSVVREEAVH